MSSPKMSDDSVVMKEPLIAPVDSTEEEEKEELLEEVQHLVDDEVYHEFVEYCITGKDINDSASDIDYDVTKEADDTSSSDSSSDSEPEDEEATEDMECKILDVAAEGTPKGKFKIGPYQSPGALAYPSDHNPAAGGVDDLVDQLETMAVDDPDSSSNQTIQTADFSGYQSDQDPDYVCPAKSDDSNDSDSGSNSSISDDEDEDQNKDKEEMED